MTPRSCCRCSTPPRSARSQKSAPTPGTSTRFLSNWARESGARVLAVDPVPQPELVALAQERDDIELVEATSLDALKDMELPDALILDGDHNYYTVSEELRLIGERASASDLPLLLFHDVCWPHARRDDYYAPEQIPAEHRHATHEGGGLFPGGRGRSRGRPALSLARGARGWPAQRGAHRGRGLRAEPRAPAPRRRAGVLRLRRRLAPRHALRGRTGQTLAFWDRNPILQRLEANRVFHLATVHTHMVRTVQAQQQVAQQAEVLQRLLNSSAFSVAERLSRLRDRIGIGRGHSIVSKADVRRALHGQD